MIIFKYYFASFRAHFLLLPGSGGESRSSFSFRSISPADIDYTNKTIIKIGKILLRVSGSVCTS